MTTIAKAFDQTSYRISGDRAAIETELADALVAGGAVKQTGIQDAVKIRETSDEALTTVLVQLGLLSQKDASGHQAKFLHMDIAPPEKFPSAPVLEDKVTRNFCGSPRFYPLARTTTP